MRLLWVLYVDSCEVVGYRTVHVTFEWVIVLLFIQEFWGSNLGLPERRVLCFPFLVPPDTLTGVVP